MHAWMHARRKQTILSIRCLYIDELIVALGANPIKCDACDVTLSVYPHRET